MKKDETTVAAKVETVKAGQAGPTDTEVQLTNALRQVRVVLTNLAAQIDALVGA